MGVNTYDYICDWLSGMPEMPTLADLIDQRVPSLDLDASGAFA